MAKRTVSVSQLAAYAANPEGFVRRKGGNINKRAARAGTRFHDRFGRSSVRWLFLVFSLFWLYILVTHWFIR